MNNWQPDNWEHWNVLRAQNPWQELGSVPSELAPPTLRPLADVLWKSVIDKTARRQQIILGPRRVGKTTVMYQTVQRLIEQGVPGSKLWWLRLDHPLLLDFDLGQLVSSIIRQTAASQSDPVYLFLDELTYANRWDLWLKTFHDEHYPIRVVGTSSATAAIRQKGNESGVGRWDEQYLSPYLFTEYLALRGINPPLSPSGTLKETLGRLIEQRPQFPSLHDERRTYLLIGGFPELLLDARKPADENSAVLKSQRILRSDAIEKAVYKDIPQAFSLRDPTKLERLLYLLAGQLAQLLSPNNIATSLEMAAKTIETYIAFLERAFLIFTLNNFSNSEESVQRRGKRVYFVDGAVRNAALLRGLAPWSDPVEMGHLIENLVASHLRALAYQEGVRVYHWRVGSQEIDLVYDHPQHPLALEITTSRSHSRSGCLAFQEKFPRFAGACYIASPEVDFSPPQGIQPGTIPLDALLLAIGAQERAALEVRIGGRAVTAAGQLLLF